MNKQMIENLNKELIGNALPLRDVNALRNKFLNSN